MSSTDIIQVENLWEEISDRALLDVRTPAEFAKGHIPGACNLPLFSNEERAEVGTLYKQKGPEQALLKGLDFVGPNMTGFVKQARKISGDRSVVIHCWRGGKRSSSMGWLLAMAGFEVKILEGGYKAYRRFIHEGMGDPTMLYLVLGGKTGCGKTQILDELRKLNEQVIDLEGLANHKGSAFGWIDEAPQPTVEQFENDLYENLRLQDPARHIWLENESKHIGRVYIPDNLWRLMKSSPLINIELPFEERLKILVDTYCQTSIEDLKLSFQKIRKRLGGQNLKMAEEALEKGDFPSAAAIALRYYDKTYQYNLENNKAPQIHFLKFEKFDAGKIAEELKNFALIQMLSQR